MELIFQYSLYICLSIRLQNKIKGTVWKEVEDEKLYRQLDLKDFEFNFSAYQKQEDSDSLNRSMNTPAKVKGGCSNH